MRRILCFSLALLLLCLSAAAEEEKCIYLSFDDGPGPYTAELLDILARQDVKACFFVTGKAAFYPALLRRMADEGHCIGLHSYSHDYRTIYASEEAYFADIEKLERLIFEETGLCPMLLRFPGGSSNTVSSFNPGIMTRLSAAVTQQGYRYVDWNVDSRDSLGIQNRESVLQNLKSGVNGQNCSVILQHDIYDYSVAAVEEFILWAKAQGYRFALPEEDSPCVHHRIAN